MKYFSTMICISLLITGCGGGGGGGGSDSHSDHGVRVLHGALDISPVDTYSSNAPMSVLARARFGQASEYSGLNEGLQQIITTTSNQITSILSSDSITVDKNGKYSLLVAGGDGTIPPIYRLLVDSPLEVDKSKSYVRVAHALIGAAQVRLKSDTAVVGSALFGTGGTYVALEPGIHALSVQRDADELVVYAKTQSLDAGKTYTILIGGEINYFISTSFNEG